MHNNVFILDFLPLPLYYSLANSDAFTHQMEAFEDQMRAKYRKREIARDQFEMVKVMIDFAIAGITGMLAFGKLVWTRRNASTACLTRHQLLDSNNIY